MCDFWIKAPKLGPKLLCLLICWIIVQCCTSNISEKRAKVNRANLNVTQHPTVRAFDFDVILHHVPLLKSLPNHTSIYHKWPSKKQRIYLMNFISAAVIKHQYPSSNYDRLMGPPIHVQVGNRLQVKLKNSLLSTGLSIHWHGFEMREALEYDGVVGVTQCPVSWVPTAKPFLYDFIVQESPGTYWYHTHSGHLGVEAYNAVLGPLIVHPPGEAFKNMVDGLNSNMNDHTKKTNSLAYENERILFFKDGFQSSSHVKSLINMGGLNSPASKNDDGLPVGTTAWEFGTTNGKIREEIHVLSGNKYKFRVINGGSHFALRVSIDELRMTVLATDSENVRPMLVDEVILHTAERFDVEINIPEEFQNKSVWIRADTLESREQGYQNGIRAILHIDQTINEYEGNIGESSLSDPKTPIESTFKVEHRKTMNCYSRLEKEKASNGGECLPITSLTFTEKYNINFVPNTYKKIIGQRYKAEELHTIDFDFQATPQFAHFVRVDGGTWTQHVTPLVSMLSPEFSREKHVHPNFVELNVKQNSHVILIWRNRSVMDHPIHLHGLKMEILDVYIPDRYEKCSLVKCELSEHFSSSERLQGFDEMPYGNVPVKDTFILPAGGSVATRILTENPALWFAHCHIDSHQDDGMSFVLNVGEYEAPKIGDWLPKDYPDCDDVILQSKRQHPSCDCYINHDAILGTSLTEHRCSRDHLCHHVHSQVANLESYVYSGGVAIRSQYYLQPWFISSTIVIAIIIFYLVAAITKYSLPKTFYIDDCKEGPEVGNLGSRQRSMITFDGNEMIEETIPTVESSLWEQFIHLTYIQYEEYGPTCVNELRVFEVTTLALLTGILFYNVGNEQSANGFTMQTSLLFFSTTLWTFTRMYPAVSSYWVWFEKEVKSKEEVFFSCEALFLSRTLVVSSLEFFWPFIYSFICFSMAGLAGSMSTLLKYGIFLMLNNLCYISLGSFLGVTSKELSRGMIASTVFSQTSLVAAGFYTTLPRGLDLIRYVSPIFWTFRGILKSSFTWSDTFECVRGQSDVGVNNCFLEFNPIIDRYKQRGINVATFNDPQSQEIYLEVGALIFLFVAMQVLIYLWCKIYYRYFDLTPRKKFTDQEASEIKSIPTEFNERGILSRLSSISYLSLSYRWSHTDHEAK